VAKINKDLSVEELTRALQAPYPLISLCHCPLLSFSPYNALWASKETLPALPAIAI